ncbi:thiol:disulfide interchange protein DsbA/DsbL [Oceanicoccus sp. KOV_DT_Chl]|uniref:thiol:disulfide interchange protein DsbA/DsbL n=1 Tax=Oceanicoccus sp. KOV_DT_Chl TaxID=1904639 RepID=UPI000C79B48D|nr:thiol:disulfide interchange protein DsbA/DsbL [Oceanicoccus sp. KOV_DT_Chl]
MNRRINFRSLIVVALLVLLTPVMAVAQEQYVAGKNYIVLDQPVRTRDSSKVEVVELFWYGCSHCYAFEPLIKQWKKQQPADVDFWQSPAMWNGAMKTHAQMFFATETMGVRDKVHDAIFTAMNVERKRFANVAEIADFLADYDVDPQQFTKTFNSFSVNSQVKQADARARSYKISGTPEVVVNGKYRVSASLAGGQAEMLKVVDFLVNKERAGLAAK